MPRTPFVFRMRVAGRDEFNRVVDAVAAALLRHIGCAADRAAEVLERLDAVLAPGADEGAGFDVEFRVRRRACDVTVSAAGREIWRASCPIP